MTAKPISGIVPFLIALWVAVPQSQPRCPTVPADGVVNASGRYCLSGTRVVRGTVGIDIKSANVTLDLGTAVVRGERTGGDTTGILVRDTAANARIVGGVIEGFATGLSDIAGAGLSVQRVTFKQSGAIAINSSANSAQFEGNIIDGVGGQPLDPKNAYAIGANLSGRGVVFQRNTIRRVDRQAFPNEVVGEAVGILIGSSCADCVITGNVVEKSNAEVESIGVWNSGSGRVDVRANRVTGFDQGVISLGRQFIIRDNTIACSSGTTSTGILMSLGRSGDPAGEGAVFSNRVTGCAIEQLMCDNGCKAPWVLESLDLERRRAKPKG